MNLNPNLSHSNPFSSSHSFSNFPNSLMNSFSLKEYTGILSSVQYYGLNHPSASNLLNTQAQTPNLNHKHFFSFTLTSPLMRLKLNQANRIYTHKSILEILQEVLGF